MTHAEVLRQFFIDNGFEITREKTATDGRRLYCIMSAEYTGTVQEHDISYIYTGRLFENNDEITFEFVSKMLSTLMKKHSALVAAGKADEENLGAVIDEIRCNMEKVKWLK